MDKGTVFPNPSRPRTIGGTDFDVPGNLLFYKGDVISLTNHEVVVYPQLEVNAPE